MYEIFLSSHGSLYFMGIFYETALGGLGQGTIWKCMPDVG
jgi:hypothetical protein